MLIACRHSDKVINMTEFKPGTEVVHHHGKQTEPQAVTHFHEELHDFRGKMTGDDATVSKNLAHFNFKKLDQELHHAHNGKPAELDAHLHASSVFKIDGKMQLVFTDDIYNKNHKSKDQTQHAYTINESTGKIDAVFDVRHAKTGEKVLVRHKEGDQIQTPLTVAKVDHTTVLRNGSDYTEYQTPDGRVIKRIGDLTTIHSGTGSTENYTREPGSGRILHNIQNDKGVLENRGGAYSKVTLGDDGTLTTSRTTGDFSTTTYPDGRRVDRNGTEGSGNIVRVTEPGGHVSQLTWGSNASNPESISFRKPGSVPYEMNKVNSTHSDNIYQGPDGIWWTATIDRSKGTIDYKQTPADVIAAERRQEYKYEP
jgi:hypothetical protein